MLYQVNEYSSQYGVSSESYKINSHHILSLSKKTTSIYKKHTIVNINVKDYLALPDTEKAKLFGWRSGVDYPEKPLEVSPYDIGTYQSYCNNYYRMSSKKRTHINTLLKDVEFELKSKSLLDIKNSKIPFSYKINSRQNRLELLAGILDGAGYKSGRKILITFKSEDYGKDVLDLGRSLNLVVDVNKVFDLYTLCFKGNLSEIPCKFINTESFVSKNNEVVQYSISVAEVGEGEYYGFELDGDHLYLLENYTVTHNTSWLLSRVTALIKNNPDLVVLDFSLDDSF
jgi:replicative DNA helicase